MQTISKTINTTLCDKGLKFLFLFLFVGLIFTCGASGRSISIHAQHEEVFAVHDVQKRDVIPADGYDSVDPDDGVNIRSHIEKSPESTILSDDPNVPKSRTKREEQRRRRRKRPDKNDQDWKGFAEEYGIFLIVPFVGMIMLLNCYICYFCCLKDGMCLVCRCCVEYIRKGSQELAENYVAGVRRDSQGKLYTDDMTLDEQKAAAALADAAMEFDDE